VRGGEDYPSICPVHPEPLSGRFWYYLPRETDMCRIDGDGNDVPVEHSVTTMLIDGTIRIEQQCSTRLSADDVMCSDRRTWVTTIAIGL